MTYPITHEGRVFTPDGEITPPEAARQCRHCGDELAHLAGLDHEWFSQDTASWRCPAVGSPDENDQEHEPEPAVLNCGHARRPVTDRSPAVPSIGTGYALIMGSYTICYPCMDAWERSFFADANVFTGYLDERRREFTTWTGAKLATVTSVTTSRRIWPRGDGPPYRLRYVRAIAPDGSRWHGKGSDAHDLITLRRSK